MFLPATVYRWLVVLLLVLKGAFAPSTSLLVVLWCCPRMVHGFCAKVEDYSLRDQEYHVGREVWIISGPSKGCRGTLRSGMLLSGIPLDSTRMAAFIALCQRLFPEIAPPPQGATPPLSLSAVDALAKPGQSTSTSNPWIVNTDDVAMPRPDEAEKQQIDYGISLHKRIVHTTVPDHFFTVVQERGRAPPGHLSVTVTSSMVSANIEHHFIPARDLTPANPTSSGQYCLVLWGELTGQIFRVKKCQSKKEPREVELDDGTKLRFGDETTCVANAHLICNLLLPGKSEDPRHFVDGCILADGWSYDTQMLCRFLSSFLLFVYFPLFCSIVCGDVDLHHSVSFGVGIGRSTLGLGRAYIDSGPCSAFSVIRVPSSKIRSSITEYVDNGADLMFATTCSSSSSCDSECGAWQTFTTQVGYYVRVASCYFKRLVLLVDFQECDYSLDIRGFGCVWFPFADRISQVQQVEKSLSSLSCASMTEFVCAEPTLIAPPLLMDRALKEEMPDFLDELLR
ncbi:hypothetical protein EDD15DRAFT_2191682 [Pisolithus albus]|nr:hypothetical protein EDD15DRAFT_2191682 [Pisolithus albus]